MFLLNYLVRLVYGVVYFNTAIGTTMACHCLFFSCKQLILQINYSLALSLEASLTSMPFFAVMGLKQKQIPIAKKSRSSATVQPRQAIA